MPGITISVSAEQLNRILPAFGLPPDGLTQQEWVIKNIKRLIKDKVTNYEQCKAADDAQAAQRALIESGFTDF